MFRKLLLLYSSFYCILMPNYGMGVFSEFVVGQGGMKVGGGFWQIMKVSNYLLFNTSDSFCPKV